MDKVFIFFWEILKERVEKAMVEDPEKLKEIDDMMGFIQELAASEDLEDYELAQKIKSFRNTKDL